MWWQAKKTNVFVNRVPGSCHISASWKLSPLVVPPPPSIIIKKKNQRELKEKRKKRNIWYSLSTILLFVCIFSPSLSCSSYLITSIFCGFGLPDTQRLRACRLTADVSSVFLPIFTCWLNRGKGLGNGEGGNWRLVYSFGESVFVSIRRYVHGKNKKRKTSSPFAAAAGPP